MRKYKNPILNCDYSDPDVIRVDDYFYLVSSSFNFVPGLPLLRSRNLLDWQLINFACKKIPLSIYDTPQHGKGLWAPSIRHHDGKFYIFVATPDEGIFYTKTSDPLSDWTELKCIKSGKGFEDPCPFWDEDGRLYLVHAFVKSRIGFNSRLALMELDPKTFEIIQEDKIIFDGTQTQPTIEGPKFYKRNGFYYIFAPAGGVECGWQTVLRSRNIHGPYEEKIVLRQGNSNINGPHQGAWISDKDGKDWFIHFQSKGIMGRVTHLQPMHWKDDWPVMGNDGTALEEWEKESDDTPLPQLTVDSHQHLANYSPEEKSTVARTFWDDTTIRTKMISREEDEISLKIDPFILKTNERSGIIFLGNQYCALYCSNVDSKYLVECCHSYGEGDSSRQEKIVFHKELSKNEGHIRFKIRWNKMPDHSVRISATICIKENVFEVEPFYTTNAHWVGGRIGWF